MICFHEQMSQMKENFVINFDEVFGDYASSLCDAHGIEPQRQDLQKNHCELINLTKVHNLLQLWFLFPWATIR